MENGAGAYCCFQGWCLIEHLWDGSISFQFRQNRLDLLEMRLLIATLINAASVLEHWLAALSSPNSPSSWTLPVLYFASYGKCRAGSTRRVLIEKKKSNLWYWEFPCNSLRWASAAIALGSSPALRVRKGQKWFLCIVLISAVDGTFFRSADN